MHTNRQLITMQSQTDEPLQREPAAPAHSVASKQLHDRWQYSSFSVAEHDCLLRNLSNLLKRANMETASWPHPPYVSTTRWMQDHPLSLQGPSFFKCLSLSPFSAVDPEIMLASSIYLYMRSLQPKLQPFSNSGARAAICMAEVC